MNVTLSRVGPDRFFIRADGRHAGGITVHSVADGGFSYGIAVAPRMRGQGVATRALERLFARMRARGFSRAFAQVEEGNTASLALHRGLGFSQTAVLDGVVYFEKTL